MPEHVLMSEIEIITDGGRRRRWSAAEKLRIVEETLDDRESISVVARRNGVAPNLLYRWRRLMLEGGSVAVTGDDEVTSNKAVRQMEDRIRELERQLRAQDARGGDPQGGAGEVTGKKTNVARAVASEGRFPMKAIAETLGVARSNLHDRLSRENQAAAALPQGARRGGAAVYYDAGGGAADLRSTYGSRRSCNRQLRAQGLVSVNDASHRRVYLGSRKATTPSCWRGRLYRAVGAHPRRQGHRHVLKPAAAEP